MPAERPFCQTQCMPRHSSRPTTAPYYHASHAHAHDRTATSQAPIMAIDTQEGESLVVAEPAGALPPSGEHGGGSSSCDPERQAGAVSAACSGVLVGGVCLLKKSRCHVHAERPADDQRRCWGWYASRGSGGERREGAWGAVMREGAQHAINPAWIMAWITLSHARRLGTRRATSTWISSLRTARWRARCSASRPSRACRLRGRRRRPPRRSAAAPALPTGRRCLPGDQIAHL